MRTETGIPICFWEAQIRSILDSIETVPDEVMLAICTSVCMGKWSEAIYANHD
jgi:hypothetical protein